jgi:DNA-binding HxlR family transcriptional regulator
MTPDRARRLIWKLWNTPIDWELVAAQQPGMMRKGSKHRRESIEKAKATKLRNRKAKQRAATERRAVELKANRRIAPHGSIHARIVSAMTPGTWHTRPAIERLAGIERDTLKGALAHMVRRGMLERRDLPRQKYAPGYEVRLTARGKALRSYALNVAGQVDQETEHGERS